MIALLLCSSRYNLDLCKNVYGEGVYPDVFMTNLYYGGTSIAGSSFTLFSPCLLYNVPYLVNQVTCDS